MPKVLPVQLTILREKGHASKRRREESEDETSSDSPRRSRRSSSDKQVLYDSKHHPMDDIMRPGAVAFRNKQKLKEKHKPMKSILKKRQPLNSSVDLAVPKKRTDRQYSESREKTPLAPAASPSIQLQRPGKDHKHVTFNPLLLSLPTNFREMDYLDQQLFVLQQGEIMGSDILRISWPEVIERLRDAELLTIGQTAEMGWNKSNKSKILPDLRCYQ